VDKKKTDSGAKKIQKQVQDGEEVVYAAKSSLVFHTDRHTINNEFHHDSYGQALRLLNIYRICYLKGN